MSKTNKSNLTIKSLILAPFIFSFGLMIIIEDSSKTLVPIVMISALTLILTDNKIKQTVKLNLSSPIVWALFAYTAYATVSYYTIGFGSSNLRGLICLTVLLTFFPYNIFNDKIVTYLVYMGATVTFINNIYHNIYSDISRESGVMNPIPYSTICAVFFVFSVSKIITSKNKKDIISHSCILIMSATSIILTETRGVWLAIFILLLTTLSISMVKSNPRKINIFLFVGLIILISFTLRDEIKNRTIQTKNEIIAISNGNLNTSIGLRLQMWLAADDYLDGNYIFGTGTNFKKKTESLYLEGKINTGLYNLKPTHLHNQFIDTFVKHGIIGLIFLLTILIAPYSCFRQKNRLAKLLIVGITALYFISGLTDVPFNHYQALIIYFLLLFPVCHSKSDFLKEK